MQIAGVEDNNIYHGTETQPAVKCKENMNRSVVVFLYPYLYTRGRAHKPTYIKTIWQDKVWLVEIFISDQI